MVSARAEWDERFENWKYRVTGLDCDREPLSLVVAIEPAFARIVVITAMDDTP